MIYESWWAENARKASYEGKLTPRLLSFNFFSPLILPNFGYDEFQSKKKYLFCVKKRTLELDIPT